MTYNIGDKVFNLFPVEIYAHTNDHKTIEPNTLSTVTYVSENGDYLTTKFDNGITETFLSEMVSPASVNPFVYRVVFEFFGCKTYALFFDSQKAEYAAKDFSENGATFVFIERIEVNV